MRKMGVCEHMVAAARATLEGTTCELDVEGVQRTVQMRQGTGQGTTLGPVLCNYFFLPILASWGKLAAEQGRATFMGDNHTSRFSSFTSNFADDTTMICDSREAATAAIREFDRYLSVFQIEA